MQVMTAGQRVSFEHKGINYIFTVNQAAVEGQEKSDALERGMISSDTYIVFETSDASGIKVYFYVFHCALVFIYIYIYFAVIYIYIYIYKSYYL